MDDTKIKCISEWTYFPQKSVSSTFLLTKEAVDNFDQYLMDKWKVSPEAAQN